MQQVISGSEMQRIEALAFAKHSQSLQETYMQKAGALVAEEVLRYVEARGLQKVVQVLVGKGHNGGDALVAARILQNQGFGVAVKLASKEDELSPLTKKMLGAFREGVKSKAIDKAGVILDGLLGTGYKGGGLKGPYALLIKDANAARIPIVAIDVPSGLSADLGMVDASETIEASLTLSLGARKQGLYLGNALDFVGELKCLDFGLDRECLAQAQNKWRYLDEDFAKENLPRIKRTRHKYESGSVFVWAGSEGMLGAASLCAKSALRTGAGMVWLMHEKGAEVCSVPLEVVKLSQVRVEEHLATMQRAKAMVVGPGLARSEKIRGELAEILTQLRCPLVLDGGALDAFSQQTFSLSQITVMTPHLDELRRLLRATGALKVDRKVLEDCQAFARLHGATLVVKGAPSFIVDADQISVCDVGDPGMATAGSGDVLAGVIGALLAQGLSARAAASLGVYLHGASGSLAASELSSYSLIASDIIEYLPSIFRSLQLPL